MKTTIIVGHGVTMIDWKFTMVQRQCQIEEPCYVVEAHTVA